MTALPPELAWADLRYNRDHATSPNPPVLGRPDVGAWCAYEKNRVVLTRAGVPVELLQAWQEVRIGHAYDVVSEIAEEGMRLRAGHEGKVFVCVPRFWWWRTTAETVPTVVMQTAVLAAPHPEPKFADYYRLLGGRGGGWCECCQAIVGREWTRARYVWTGPNGYDTWLCAGCRRS